MGTEPGGAGKKKKVRKGKDTSLVSLKQCESERYGLWAPTVLGQGSVGKLKLPVPRDATQIFGTSARPSSRQIRRLLRSNRPPRNDGDIPISTDSAT